ncbi:MAG: hypothetical protein QXV17_11090 [Candidatus Micrarchaeaceae archaeon]
MANLLDESIKEKYRQYFINDPLKFMKESIEWSAFSPLLKDLYHNDTEEGGRHNIPVITMVKILFFQHYTTYQTSRQRRRFMIVSPS